MGEYLRGAGRIRGYLCNTFAVASAMSKRTSLLDICLGRINGVMGRYKVAYDTRTSLHTNTGSRPYWCNRYCGRNCARTRRITPAPDLMRAIRFAVASAMSKMTLLLDIGMGRINWAYRKLQSRI